MKISIESHTLIRAIERGTNKKEILEVIKTGKEAAAKHGKIAKFKIYDFNKKWLGEEKLVGIEIMNASKRINLEKILPIKHKISNKVAS